MKRSAFIFISLTAIVILLASQSAAFGQATPSSLAGAISFYVFGDSAEKAAYTTLVAAFNQRYPAVTVNLVYTPGEDEMHAVGEEDAYRARLSLDFASSKPPDVFLMNYREYRIFSEKDAIQPVGPYLDKSSVIKAGDFYAQALAPFMRNGTLDCVPQNISGTVVYYNKTLFDKAKLSYPKDGWTWDDFVKDATAMTLFSADGKTNQYGAGIDPSFARLMPFIWENGGDLLDKPDAPTRLTLDSPAAKAAFQWFVDLQGKDRVTPDETLVNAEGIQERFLDGTEGMILFSRRLVPSLRQVSFDWDVAPLPAPAGKPSATLLYSDGYCMAKGSQNKDAAWALIEYANSPDGQSLLGRTGRTVPSLKAVAQSPAFLDPIAKPNNSQLFLDLIANGRTSPVLDNWADIEEAVNQGIEGAFYGDMSVDEAVTSILDNTKSYFAPAK